MRTRGKKRGLMDQEGFTLIEVLISMALTIVVMGAVFGLLTRGQRTFQREPQVTDLQQNARIALDMVSRDALQAGTGLPPEFPAFTPPSLDASVGNQDPDVIEIIGESQAPGEMYLEPEHGRLDGTGTTFTVGETLPVTQQVTQVQPGDLVVVYDDNQSQCDDWLMAWVEAVEPGPPPMVTLAEALDGVTVPAHFSNAALPLSNARLARVSVVRYFTEQQGSDLVLMRQVDFGIPMPVAMLDDFQVTYLQGTQVPVELQDPPDPLDGLPITAAWVVSGVRITVAARSVQENLEGSTRGASGNYIRKTFSSNVSPRNILAGLGQRTLGVGPN